MDHHGRVGGGGGVQESNLNVLFKSIAPLVKQLDERRARAKCLVDLFDEDVTAWRQELVQGCEDAFFDDQDSVSPKPREIMWRKGYYDTISMAKRFIHKHQKSQAAAAALDGGTTTANKSHTLVGMEQLRVFIDEGMLRLKKIIIRIEKDYNLDLEYIVDFSLFENGDVELPQEQEAIPINKKITSLEIINFALESIHSLIVSLGDLHRYYLDFGLSKDGPVTPELTASVYEQAFKLNPKIGMPQNQLGTLWIGRNYNLDSVYHYLYSLVCPKPFELSEDNVMKIFNQGAAYLEALVMPKDYQVTKRDFVARFLLIVDIFFFDKNVPTFNDLCRFLLCDLNTMLRRRREDTGEPVLDQDFLFKLTLILFFCMSNLKAIKSPKVFQLNAFLAAICDQFAECCNENFKEFFDRHAAENEEYEERYQEAYKLYYSNQEQDEKPRQRRNGNSLLIDQLLTQKRKDENGHNGLLSGASTTADDGVSQEASSSSPIEVKFSGDGRGNKSPLDGVRGKGDQGVERNRNKSVSSTAAANGEGKKRVMRFRRRRRRSTYTSDSDLTSNFDSDSERSEDDSEYSDDEDDDSEDDDEYYSEGDQEAEPQEQNVTLTNGNGLKSHLVAQDDDLDDDSDVVIEEETIVMVNGQQSPQTTTHPSDDSPATQESNQNPLEDQLEALCIGDRGEEDDGSGDQKRDRLRHKMSQMKYDPNLLLQFVDKEPTIRALKVLFDWLMDNKEIIWECFQSNPEFVHKMMNVLNTVNVNIFTRRVFFDRRLLTVDGLREDIRSLFDLRAKMPITEDLRLKHFGEFTRAQVNLDWEVFAQLQVTPAEENLLRVVKFKNFGFFICDRKKFGYAFRNCRFEEIDTETVRRRQNAKKADKREARRHGQGQKLTNGWGGGGSQGSGSGENRRERRRRQRRMMRNGEVIGDADGFNNNHGDGGGGGGRRRQRRDRQTNGNNRKENGRQQEQRTRGRGGGGGRGLREGGNGDARIKENDVVSREKEMLKKGELMGKLWLRNEVKNLESKARGPKGMGLLTPYVVVDTKALVQHLSIVKHFVSMKKFIVLIPTEVLAELDGLKVSHDRARECIRWLDRTISNGSTFLKTQEMKEKLPIRDYVKPRQGMRTETSSFVEIAEFCHFLAKKYEIDGQSADVLTLLTGEDLTQKVTPECDYVGVLRSIPIKFDRIDKFYGKLIKK